MITNMKKIIANMITNTRKSKRKIPGTTVKTINVLIIGFSTSWLLTTIFILIPLPLVNRPIHHLIMLCLSQPPAAACPSVVIEAFPGLFVELPGRHGSLPSFLAVVVPAHTGGWPGGTWP
jgi:hypothetical protein